MKETPREQQRSSEYVPLIRLQSTLRHALHLAKPGIVPACRQTSEQAALTSAGPRTSVSLLAVINMGMYRANGKIKFEGDEPSAT